MSTSELFNIAAALLLAAGTAALVDLAFKSGRALRVVRAVNVIAVLLLAAGFGLRWKYYIETMDAGWLLSFPVSTFYESASFFFLALLAASLAASGRRTKAGSGRGQKGRTAASGGLAGVSPNESLLWCAVDFFVGAGILGLSLAGISAEPVLFLPSLKSYWLLAHVALSFVAYGMFALAAILSVLVLVRREGAEESAARIRALVRAGAVVFTIGGIFFGAMWAQTSWGRFWAWDPKETWAFITWCCYLALIHFDRGDKLTHKQLAVFALVNFFVVIFTFVGVNLLFAGLHSYALIKAPA